MLPTVCIITHWVMIIRTLLGEEPAPYFGSMRGPILTEDLEGPNTSGEHTNFSNLPGFAVETTVSDECVY